MTGARLALAAAALLAAAPARAAETQASWSLEPSHRAARGPDGYLAGDTSLYAGLPGGLHLDLGHAYFRTDSTSMTHTYSVGGGWDWEQVSLSGSHSLTPRTEGYAARSWDAGVAVDTGSKEFKTTFAARLCVTYHSYVLALPAFTQRVEVTQRAPSLRLSQALRGAVAEVEVSENDYNKSLAGVVNDLKAVDPKGRRSGGLKGTVKGFPEHSVRVGLRQRLEPAGTPLTLWGGYQNTKLVDTGKVLPGGRVDSYKGGADLELLEALTVGAEYEHIRQTEQGGADYYGVSLSARF